MFLRNAALGGAMSDLLYWGSHRHLINCQGGRGGEYSPSIKLRSGPSINWSISKGGRVYCQGKFINIGEAHSICRRAFHVWGGASSAQAAFTGWRNEQLPSPFLSLGQLREEWVAGRRDTTLFVKRAIMFDECGFLGIWDNLEASIGTRFPARNSSIPWVILTKTRVHIKVYPNGKLIIDPGAGSADDATVVEQCLQAAIGALRIPVVDFKSREGIITFGTWGESAKNKARVVLDK